MSANPQWLHCPACRREYRWDPALAGRKARCAGCRAILRMPSAPDEPVLLLPESTTASSSPASPTASSAGEPREAKPDPTPNVYEIDDPSAPKAIGSGVAPASDPTALPPVRANAPALRTTPGRCSSCGLSVKPDAVICMNCGFDFRQGAALQTQVVEAPAEAEPSEPAGPGAPPANASGDASALLASGRAAPYAHLAAQAEARQAELADIARTHRFNDLYVPLIVVAIGAGLLLLDVFVLMYIYQPVAPTTITVPNVSALTTTTMTIAAPPVPSPLAQRMLRLAVNAGILVFQFPFLLLGLFVVARLFGTSFGQLHIGLIKLLAMAICCRGIIACSDSILCQLCDGSYVPGQGLITGSIGSGAFWGLCAWLLEMEYLEVFALGAISFVVPLFIGFLIATAFLP
ncbi:MAG: hypothetical protein NTW19_10470 [Planctomycetota bacterium]|nr:hypothetical protein [Planctomycetota bacterium]